MRRRVGRSPWAKFHYIRHLSFKCCPQKNKGDSKKQHFLAGENIKSIAFYVDKHINTYLKEEQSLHEIRNCKTDNKRPNEFNTQYDKR